MHRRRIFVLLGFVLVAVLSALDHAGAFGYRGGDRSRYEGAVAKITHAADGDTIDVDIPDGSRPVTRIRLWGIDCPEIAHGVAETDAYFGREAADYVRKEIVGRKVRLAMDPGRAPREKYGRLLAYVYLEDTGEMLNELLIERGLAYADRRFAHVFNHQFVERERIAKRGKAGLWARLTPQQMPAWRQRMGAAGASLPRTITLP